MMGHDTDPHSVDLVGMALSIALVLVVVFAIGSCIAGMGG